MLVSLNVLFLVCSSLNNLLKGLFTGRRRNLNQTFARHSHVPELAWVKLTHVVDVNFGFYAFSLDYLCQRNSATDGNEVSYILTSIFIFYSSSFDYDRFFFQRVEDVGWSICTHWHDR